MSMVDGNSSVCGRGGGRVSGNGGGRLAWRLSSIPWEGIVSLHREEFGFQMDIMSSTGGCGKI